MSLKHRLAAYEELWNRYRRVTMNAWRARKTHRFNAFTEDEARFLPGALSLQETPVSPTAILTSRLVSLLILAILGWSVWGRIDVVVNAQGKVIPSAHVKTIASVDTSSVRALYVLEGQAVKAGDLLIELDASASDAERDKAALSRTHAVLQAARAHAMISALDSLHPPVWPGLQALQHDDPNVTIVLSNSESLHLDGIYRDFLAKLTRIQGDISRYSDALPLVTRTAEDYFALLRTHDVSEHSWLEKDHARLDLEGQLAEAKNQRNALYAEARRNAYDELTAAAKEEGQARQDAFRSQTHSQLLRLRSPVDGVVQQLTVHTVGGVVAAAQPLMQIVPSHTSLEVEALLDNKDIGFVREGQSAQVKVDAFEYTKYGTVDATVSHLSRDAIQDERKDLHFSARVLLHSNTIILDGTQLRLSPGMSVSVEIKTGQRRLIEYFLSPLLQKQHESFNER